MTIKSDMDVMDELSKKFQEQIKLYEDSDKNLQNILTDLEYLLHQVDTAEVFVKNKGCVNFFLCLVNFVISYNSYNQNTIFRSELCLLHFYFLNYINYLTI